MSNDYYNPTGIPGTGAPGASQPVRSEFADIGEGFDKLPTVTGNGSKAVIINSGGTAMTVTTGTLALAGNFATTGAFNTTLVQGARVSLSLPLVSGTLATLAGTETLSNKTLVTPALGTPASGVLTNCTGTAAGLTAGNVTTNANLTGPITSTGNATAVGAQTGTGSTFVMATSPTLTTPNIGIAIGTSLALGGATIGSNAIAVTGTGFISGAFNVGTASTNYLQFAGSGTNPTIGTNGGSVSITSALLTLASATGTSGVNMPHGTAPSSPVNGDVWTTTAGIYVRINGVTVGPLAAGSDYWSAPRYVSSADSPVAAVDRDIIYVTTSAAVEIDLPASGRVWIIDRTGGAATYNITVDPAGADTTTIDIIDLAYFSAVFTRNASGNWDIS